MKVVPLSDEEKDIRQQLEKVKHVVGDQIVYGTDHERGTVLHFDLHGCYLGMPWREKDQRQNRLSLAKGHYKGVDKYGNIEAEMHDLLKLRVSTLKQRMHRAKDASAKSKYRLALKLALKTSERSEKFMAGIDHLCLLLHRPPTKFELRNHLKMSGSTFSEVTTETGFKWLPERNRWL